MSIAHWSLFAGFLLITMVLAGTLLTRLPVSSAMIYLAFGYLLGPGAKLWLGIAARWKGAQEVGLRWYNGVDGWDRRSGWDAFRTAVRWSLAQRRAA